MRFEHSMRGQTVVINYGTNPQGQVAGVWVELADGGQADGLTATEELAAWRLATQHNAERQERINMYADMECARLARLDAAAKVPA